MDEESPEGEPVYLELADALELALQAAALAHGIAESQTFVDGNKRLALVAMLTFVEINDRGVDASDAELAAWIISLSEGTTPEQLAELIRERIRSLP